MAESIITCADCDETKLRGETINMLFNSQLKSDEAAWSIKFTSFTGNEYFLPAKRCKSWFVSCSESFLK